MHIEYDVSIHMLYKCPLGCLLEVDVNGDANGFQWMFFCQASSWEMLDQLETMDTFDLLFLDTWYWRG